MQDLFSEKSAAITDEGFCILPHPTEMATPTMETSALADYLRRVMMENDLTNVAVQNQSRKRGGTLGKSSVDQILQGRTLNPGIFTIQELAWGINRPVEEVLTAALGMPLAESSAFRKSDFANLWDIYRQLPTSEQKVFKRLLEMFYRELVRAMKQSD